jgi:hypothetical protein
MECVYTIDRKDIWTELLALIDKQLPELYAKVEDNTSYPDNDRFDAEDLYNKAVDNAELEALADMIIDYLEGLRS